MSFVDGCYDAPPARRSGWVPRAALSYMALSGKFSVGFLAASEFGSHLTTFAMQRQRPALYQPPAISVSPATCLPMPICAPPLSTTIGPEGSKPAGHIGR